MSNRKLGRTSSSPRARTPRSGTPTSRSTASGWTPSRSDFAGRTKRRKKSTVKQDHLQTNRTVRDILAVSQQNRHNNLTGRDLLARLEHLYSFQAISLGSRSPSVPPLPPSPLSPRQSLSPFGKKRRISRSIDHSICHAALPEKLSRPAPPARPWTASSREFHSIWPVPLRGTGAGRPPDMLPL